jgi:hypothetical protein
MREHQKSYYTSMPNSILNIRVVASTIKDGRVGFNQVVMRRSPDPAGLLLVGIDPSAGLYVWLKPHDDIVPITSVQVPGYSDCIGAFSVAAPPPELGNGVFIDSRNIPATLWAQITTARTNTLHKAVSDALGL